MKSQILIVEDERLVSEDLRAVLQDYDYEIVGMVTSGEEALEIASNQKPDLVLMDIVLKGEMTGVQAAESLRFEHNIPVIYLTAYADEKTLEQAKITEPFGYILKPFEDRELISSIEMALYKNSMENKIRERERNFSAIAENAHDGILVMSSDGTPFYVNHRICRMTGLSVKELHSLNISYIFPDLDSFDRQQILKTNNKHATLETALVKKTGTNLTVELTVSSTTWHGKDAFLCIIRDISERKRFEEKLEHSQQEYKSLYEYTNEILNSSPIGLVRLDKDLRIQYQNPELGHIIGRPVKNNAQEAIGHDIRSIPGTKGDKIFSLLQDLQHGKDFDIEFTYYSVYGKKVELHVLGRPLFENGEVTGSLLMLEDITRRKESERLQQVLYQISNASNLSSNLNEFFKSIQSALSTVMDTQNFFIALVDEKDKDSIILPYFIDEKDDFKRVPRARTLTSVVIDENRPILIDRNGIEKYLREDKLDKTGTICESWLGVPLRSDGNVLGAVVVQSYTPSDTYTERDKNLLEFVSEQIALAIEKKWSYDSAVREKELLQLLMNNMPDTIVFKDKQCRFIRGNRALAERFNLESPDELVGKNDFDFYDKESAQKTFQEEQKILQTGEALLDKVHRGVLKHERDKWFSTNKVPTRDNNGNINGLISISRDISAQKTAEQEIQKNQRLESIGQLAGGIAHDFNNNLSTILGNAQLAKMKTKEPQLIKCLGNIETSVSKAHSLTQQLLTFAKGGQPVKELTDMTTIIHEAVNLALTGSNCKCQFNIDENLWPAKVDHGQIHQVLSNLLINADNAMPNGGTIQIAAENIHLEKDNNFPSLSAGNYIKISVQDKGIGIAEKELSKIFDPYYTTKQKGSGLGLSIVHAIIKKHGGHIFVESQPEEGTNLYFYLPAQPSSVPPEKEKEDAPDCPSASVLVMDDDELVLEMARTILENYGFSVCTVDDGKKTLKEYQRRLNENRPFDVVIMDLTVPGGMGGKKTITELLKIDPNAKAVVSSGYSNDPVLANYENFGFHAVATKPYKIEDLLTAIKQALDHQN